jgi:hypothetical protein
MPLPLAVYAAGSAILSFGGRLLVMTGLRSAATAATTTAARTVAVEAAEVAAATAARQAAAAAARGAVKEGAEEVLEAGVKAASTRGLSVFDKVALNSAKTQMALTGYVVADVATGNSITRDYLLPGVINTAEILGRIPLVGSWLQSSALSAGDFALGVLSYGMDTAVEGAAQIAERAGFEDEAVAGRLAYAFGTRLPIIAAKAMAAPESERANVFVSEIEDSGISQAEMIKYLSAYPDKVERLRVRGIDLSTALPGLDAAIASRAASAAESNTSPASASASMSAAFGAVALSDVLRGTENLKGEPLKAAFDKVGSLVDHGKVDLGWGFGIVRWLADKLGDLPLVGDWIRGFAMDIARGQIAGMTTGVTGINGPGIVAATPAVSVLAPAQAFAPAPG